MTYASLRLGATGAAAVGGIGARRVGCGEPLPLPPPAAATGATGAARPGGLFSEAGERLAAGGVCSPAEGGRSL